MKVINGDDGAYVVCLKCGTKTRFVDLSRASKGYESHITEGTTKTSMDSIGCRQKLVCPNCGGNLWEQQE